MTIKLPLVTSIKMPTVKEPKKEDSINLHDFKNWFDGFAFGVSGTLTKEQWEYLRDMIPRLSI